MISKAKSSWIRSLHQKKFREELGLFIAEGDKITREALASGWNIRHVAATHAWLKENELILKPSWEISEVSEEELQKISTLKTAHRALAVLEKPVKNIPDPAWGKKVYLCFDDIQDPGNLGTILRICDWFGMGGIICSSHSVENFNPKCVQASMGSIFRIPVWYDSLENILSAAKTKNIPSYGTFLEGTNIYDAEIAPFPLIVFGNESKGISDKVAGFCSHRISIPRYLPESRSAESLNISIATAVICAEYNRRHAPSYSK